MQHDASGVRTLFSALFQKHTLKPSPLQTAFLLSLFDVNVRLSISLLAKYACTYKEFVAFNAHIQHRCTAILYGRTTKLN